MIRRSEVYGPPTVVFHSVLEVVCSAVEGYPPLGKPGSQFLAVGTWVEKGHRRMDEVARFGVEEGLFCSWGELCQLE